MRKTSDRKRAPAARADMQREYRLDYRRAKPNRFAAAMRETTIAVVLDPDVAVVFRSSESVNALLRSVLSALPPPGPPPPPGDPRRPAPAPSTRG